MRKGKISIGTSGWHYKHWKGTYYPADIKEADQFSYYQREFSTVEQFLLQASNDKNILRMA